MSNYFRAFYIKKFNNFEQLVCLIFGFQSHLVGNDEMALTVEIYIKQEFPHNLG